MQIKFFSIPTFGSTEIEDELNSFLRGHRVLEVERELVREGGSAFWAIAVFLMEARAEVGKKARAAKVDYREVLNAQNCRSANRNSNSPGNRNNNLGVRLALSSGPVGLKRVIQRTEPVVVLLSGGRPPGTNPRWAVRCW